MEISLHDLLKRNKYPREKIHKLTLQDLQKCLGFNVINLVGFQSDRIYEIQHFDFDPFKEFEYSDGKSCFVYYSLKEDEVNLDNDLNNTQPYSMVHTVRLDHLLDRELFPRAYGNDESDSDNDDDEHAISEDAINNSTYLNRVKEIHEFLYSFEP